MSVDLAAVEAVDRDELLDLYGACGWGAYTADPDGLERAVAQSTFVVTAREGGRLVGLARCLSDDVSICYLQDILVHPERQRQGIGRALLERCLERFEHVRSKVLMTDDEERQHAFYRSLGFKESSEVDGGSLHVFVQIDGL